MASRTNADPNRAAEGTDSSPVLAPSSEPSAEDAPLLRGAAASPGPAPVEATVPFDDPPVQSHAGVSAASYGYLLDLFRSRSGWTRQQLLETTGVSRTTLYDRLDVLFQEGLVYSAGTVTPPDATGPPPRGRRSELLRFDDRDKIVLVIDAGQVHVNVCVADLRGNLLRMSGLRLAIDTDPAPYLEKVFAAADALLAGGTETLVGVALGIPGPVDPATGALGRSTTMPQWQSFAIVETIRKRWPVPVVIENDAHAFALGEVSAAGSPGSIIAIKYSTGIGAGIVVGGDVLRGSDGAAGDIGHVQLSPDGGPVCTCGRRGCLAAYASGHALVRDLRHTGVQTVDDVVALAAGGDAVVVRAVEQAVDRLSHVLGAIVTAVNPELVVLGGTLGRLPLVVERIDRQVRTAVVDRATGRLRVTSARLGDHGVTTGLARQVVDAVYAPESINAALAARTAATAP